MMGHTHGLAGTAIGAGFVLALKAAGQEPSTVDAVCITAAGAIAGELADLDLSHSRISTGASSLTALPGLSRVAFLITLPVVLVGWLIRRTGVKHRGPTHSYAAAAGWAIGIVPLYLGYLALLAAAAGYAAGTAPPELAAWLGDHIEPAADDVLSRWLALAPLVIPSVFLAYGSHLLLDQLAKTPLAVWWPASDTEHSLPGPKVKVGGLIETFLIALPLALITVALLWVALGAGDPSSVG